MNRYLVFSGSTYYPVGGGDDFNKAFTSLELEKAKALATSMGSARYEWAHVFDCETNTVIFEVGE